MINPYTMYTCIFTASFSGQICVVWFKFANIRTMRPGSSAILTSGQLTTRGLCTHARPESKHLRWTRRIWCFLPPSVWALHARRQVKAAVLLVCMCVTFFPTLRLWKPHMMGVQIRRVSGGVEGGERARDGRRRWRRRQVEVATGAHVTAVAVVAQVLEVVVGVAVAAQLARALLLLLLGRGHLGGVFLPPFGTPVLEPNLQVQKVTANVSWVCCAGLDYSFGTVFRLLSSMLWLAPLLQSSWLVKKRSDVQLDLDAKEFWEIELLLQCPLADKKRTRVEHNISFWMRSHKQNNVTSQV